MWQSNISYSPEIDHFPAYPELASVIGATVPDYRGRFLRHVGGNSAALGVAQGDAIRNVTGVLNFWGWPVWTTSGPFIRDGASTQNYRTNGVVKENSADLRGYGHSNFDLSRSVPTAVENRPANMAVKYLIFRGD